MENYPNNSKNSTPREESSDSSSDTKSSKTKSSDKSWAQTGKSESRVPIFEPFADKTKNKLTEPEPGLYEYLKALSPDKELPSEASESVAPTEHLGAEEKRLAGSEVTKGRLSELAAETEIIEPDSPEAAANEGSQLYMHNLYDKFNKFQPDELTAEESIDMAAAETKQQLSIHELTHEFGLPFEEKTQEESEIGQAAETYEAETLPLDDLPEASHDTPVTAAAGSSHQGAMSTGDGAGAAAGLGAAGAGGGPNGPNIPNIPTSFALPPAANPNNYVPNSAVYNTGHSPIERTPSREGSMFIVGAIVGYFVGRRRGRIKTEERLKPIQKKLENEVHSLSARIAARETQIRQLAYTKATQEKLLKQQSAQNEDQSRQVLSAKPEQPAIEKTPAVAAGAIGSQALMQETAPKSEASSEHVFIQSQALKSSEKPLPQAEQLASQEVLDLSQTIKVDGVSLREMYNSNQIDDRSLRLLVSEHLAGGNVGKVLHQELKQKEIRRPSEAKLPEGTSRSSAGSSILNSQSPNQPPSPKISTATYQALPENQHSQNTTYQPSSIINQPHDAERKTGRTAAAAVIIILLAVVIFWLVR